MGRVRDRSDLLASACAWSARGAGRGRRTLASPFPLHSTISCATLTHSLCHWSMLAVLSKRVDGKE